MKKIISLIILAVLITTLLPTYVSAYDFDDGKIRYVITNNEAAVTECWEITNGCGHPVTGDLIIPESINLSGVIYPVTKINQNAFSTVELTSLTIPSSITKIDSKAFNQAQIETINIQCNITKIENSAFECCRGKNINLPESITEIGDSAFKSSNFQSINLPKNLKKVGSNAFYDSAIENINIPNGVTEIGSNAFYSSNLKTVNIPDSVTEIGSGAFENCLELTFANLGNGITTIEENTFQYCPSLKNVTLPNSITKIEGSAFANCFVLENITLGENVESIGERAFLSCRALKSITIPNKITTIETNTFLDCSSLKSIKIGKNITKLCGNPFAACSSLECLTVEEGNPYYYSVNNCLIDKRTKVLIQGCKNSIIPSDSSVTTIGESAFECINLISVDIPKGITVIEDRAFAQSNTLKSVNIPKGVTKIGTNAFVACLKLEKVCIPSTVSSIGDYVFTYCDKLVIYGTTGSYAQTYAKAQNIPFVANDHNHTYGEWSETKLATCTETGAKNHACTECGYKETATVEALGHDFQNSTIIKEPSLTAKGLKESSCVRCSEKQQEELACSFTDEIVGAKFEVEDGVFQDGAKILINEIKVDSENYKTVKNSLKNISSKFVAYDISAVLNDAKTKPNGQVKITLKIPEDFSDNVAVFFVSDDGENEKLDSIVNEDRTITFTTSHFSAYVIGDLDVLNENDTNFSNNNSTKYAILIVSIILIISVALTTFIFIKKKYKKR